MLELREGRRDFSVYSEATAFYLCSKGLGDSGEPLRPDEASWRKAVLEGAFVPIMLAQDDSFTCRVVLGELNAVEEREWVGRVSWKLRLPDGVLVVAAGSEFLRGEVDADDDSWQEFIRCVEVPAGDYRVTVCSHLPGINGEWLLELAGQHEALGTWFRRTRPDHEMPPWLAYRAASSDDAEQSGADLDALADSAEENECLGFVIQLEPLDDWDSLHELPPLTEGHFTAEEIRKPEPFPLGIPGEDISEPEWEEEEQEEEAAAWDMRPTAAVDVWQLLDDCRPEAIDGGPCVLPIAELGLVHRLAVCCNDAIDGGLTITAPSGQAIDTGLIDCGDLVITQTATGLTIAFGEAGARWGLDRLIGECAGQLGGLPDGCIIDALFGDPEHVAGRHRYRGPLREGQWLISETYPSVPCSALRDALDILRAAAGTEGLTAQNAQEADRVLERFSEDPLSRLARIERDGATMSCSNRSVMDELAACLLYERYHSLWVFLD